ncbi:hypothetical protein CHS0354_021749 [Potamilus streckersoni]|uniref:BLOC-1-related complex subunit 6 C-terminal helix domain-containing protein n=1 Tax=Potamilus streckersoni TaxID=2493646 RepID=A0AAE0WEV4_9BIVA|nr:hypothetical protein CHS0354_021749 [Potamilus streckersoni]
MESEEQKEPDIISTHAVKTKCSEGSLVDDEGGFLNASRSCDRQNVLNKNGTPDVINSAKLDSMNKDTAEDSKKEYKSSPHRDEFYDGDTSLIVQEELSPHGNTMVASHGESGYLTDSVHSVTPRGDRLESVDSTESSVTYRESRSPNDFNSNHEEGSSDEKSTDTLEYLESSDKSPASKSNRSENLDCIPRPDSLLLPKSLQIYEQPKESSVQSLAKEVKTRKSHDRQRSQSSAIPISRNKERVDISEENLSRSLPHGMIMRKGDMIEFIADDLQEMIRRSSPRSRTESSGLSSSTSSLRSINSTSSSASSAMGTSFTSGMSRSASSFLQQSPDSIPPIDPQAVIELENQARMVADSLDLMMGNLKSNLHKMSAISVGCLGAYKTSVDLTCDSVDASIKSMYAMMAKCEELSKSMEPVYRLADQVKEIKRLLCIFESQLTEKSP